MDLRIVPIHPHQINHHHHNPIFLLDPRDQHHHHQKSHLHRYPNYHHWGPTHQEAHQNHCLLNSLDLEAIDLLHRLLHHHLYPDCFYLFRVHLLLCLGIRHHHYHIGNLGPTRKHQLRQEHHHYLCLKLNYLRFEGYPFLFRGLYHRLLVL